MLPAILRKENAFFIRGEREREREREERGTFTKRRRHNCPINSKVKKAQKKQK